MESQADTESSAEDEFGPIEDQSKKWELIAAREYQFDGNADGWDSDVAEEETAEQKYIKVYLHNSLYPSTRRTCLASGMVPATYFVLRDSCSCMPLAGHCCNMLVFAVS